MRIARNADLFYEALLALAFYSQILPGATLPAPKIFSPGVISGPGSDGSPSFSPDGKALLFTRSSSRWSLILESRKAESKQSGEGWLSPRVASFSGTWSDASPAMSPDGSYLVFVSVRPRKGDLKSKAQASQSSSVHMVSHIWRVTRTNTGWGIPEELPIAVNFCDQIFRPSVAGDGSVYFTAAGQGKNLRLFRSRRENGVYQRAEPLPFSDGSVKDVDPEIAPDQSFLIFASLGRGAGEPSHEKLFISHCRAGVWGDPSPLRYEGDEANGSSDDNDARLGPDHRTLYFSSDRSPVVHFPRTQQQIQQDFERLQNWDNGNVNIWSFVLGAS